MVVVRPLSEEEEFWINEAFVMIHSDVSPSEDWQLVVDSFLRLRSHGELETQPDGKRPEEWSVA